MKEEEMDDIDKVLYKYFEAYKNTPVPEEFTEMIKNVDLSKCKKRKKGFISRLLNLWK